jgi:hypothetical protein
MCVMKCIFWRRQIVLSRAWEVHKTKRKKNAHCAKKKIQFVRCQYRKKSIYVIFKACIALGSRLEKYFTYSRVLYTPHRRWRSEKRKKNVISILLARQKPCTQNLVDDFYSLGMLLPYYKLGCPHMDFFLVVDWKPLYIFVLSLSRIRFVVDSFQSFFFYDFKIK